jgi:hypothetical protein
MLTRHVLRDLPFAAEMLANLTGALQGTTTRQAAMQRRAGVPPGGTNTGGSVTLSVEG